MANLSAGHVIKVQCKEFLLLAEPLIHIVESSGNRAVVRHTENVYTRIAGVSVLTCEPDQMMKLPKVI
jgi:hypothetical protein